MKFIEVTFKFYYNIELKNSKALAVHNINTNIRIYAWKPSKCAYV